MRQVPEKALELIRQFEGLRLKAYKCPAGKWTISYGITDGVHEGMEITKDQAEIMLLNKAQEVCNSVCKLVKVPLTDNELSALISFAFNLGIGSLKESTLLKQLNKGLYDLVPQELMKWVHVNGVELGGLVRRRRAEAALWNTRDYPLTC